MNRSRRLLADVFAEHKTHNQYRAPNLDLKNDAWFVFFAARSTIDSRTRPVVDFLVPQTENSFATSSAMFDHYYLESAIDRFSIMIDAKIKCVTILVTKVHMLTNFQCWLVDYQHRVPV